MPYMKTQGFSMFYTTSGKGPPVLLIHGLGSDHRGWEYQEDDMKQHFRLVVPDLRGHGQSEGGFTDFIPAHQFAEDLDHLLTHLHIDKARVVGHSLGGIVAQQFALDYPNRVERLVLVGTTPKVTEEIADVVLGWREAQLEDGMEAYFWATVRSGFTPQWVKNNPDIINHLKERAADVKIEGAVAAGLGLAMTDLVDRLPEISAPTLIIHGDQDGIINIKMGRLINKGIRGSTFHVFKGCGHSPTVEKREEFNRLLVSYLKG